MRITAVLLFIWVVAASSGQAQSPACWTHWQAIGAPFTDLDRSRELLDSASIPARGVVRYGRELVRNCMPRDTAAATVERRLELGVLPAAAVTQSNSEYPRVQQDGLRWSGRGVSATIQAGAAARFGPVTAAFVPAVALQQNDAFEIIPVQVPGLSRFASFNNVGLIDDPQRFGSSASTWLHPGQSFIRIDAFGAGAGVSTENMRWGPSRRNPILMAATAPGFPHVFVGTSKPLDLRILDLDVEASWGRLAESEYFDTISNNDSRLFAGIVATLTPKHSGLTLGVARAYLRTIPEGGLSLGEQILGPYRGIRVNPQDETGGDNQLVSVFLSWTSSGLEFYGEYAREDHWEDANDLLMQLDHSRGYTVGFEKAFSLHSTDMLRVMGEATNLGNSATFQSRRDGGAFYAHSQVRQGYTHKGQILGAPIGPGSDAQYLAVDYITPRMLGGLYYQRARYDNDVYYLLYAWERGNRGHDTEWTLGLRGGGVLRDFQIVADLAFSRRYNRDFVGLSQTNTFTKDNNLSLSLGAAWVPAGLRIVP